jgi:tetratricopeptide (TPR) repeat protein
MAEPTIELSMIVKDGATTLERCIRSVASCVDRVVVGDTGSTDATAEIARKCGAAVVQIPWERDFARARNRMLKCAKCDWILVLDADEMLDEQGRRRIPELIARRDVDAYDIWRWNYVRGGYIRSGEQAAIPNPIVVEESRPYPAYTLTLNTRLFRCHPGVFFEHCVHETVSGRLQALGRSSAQADFVIHHFGMVEDAEPVREGKNEFYHQLGLRKLETEPGNSRAWFEVGLSEFELHRRPAEALAYFEKACSLAPQYSEAWLYAGMCLVRTGKLSEALKRFSIALKLGLRSPVLFEAIGDAYFYAGRYEQAREAYEQTIAVGGISPLNNAKLGASEVCLGLAVQGIGRMKQAVETSPEYVELYDILIAGALLAGDKTLAEQTAEAKISAAKSDHCAPVRHPAP